MLLRRILQRFAKQKSIYSDSVELSEEEINKILLKTSPEEQKYTPEDFKFTSENYEKDIRQIIEEVQQVNEQRITPVEEKESIKVPEAKYYKYGLPIPNLGVDLAPKQAEPPKTIVMKVFDMLQLNEHTSYQEYENAISKFNTDMYGNIQTFAQERAIQREELGQYAVPMHLIRNAQYMQEVRTHWSLNLSMPGAIENEHPHRFLKVRPVEEFRHTPLIPISDRQMKEWKLKVEEYHRKGFYLEIKKEQVYASLFFIGIGLIMVQMLQLVLRKEEEQGIQFQRLKLRRMGMTYEAV